MYTKTVDNIEGMLWLANHTLNTFCYSPPRNAMGFAPKHIVIVEWIIS